MADPRPLTPDPRGVFITLAVNGREERLSIRTHHTLLEVLRDRLKLHSVREGCGIGMCGACTVLVGGKPISSCLTLAVMAEDRALLTVEGLGEGALADGTHAKLDLVQEAFLAHTGFQCSYCTPGILLTARALLNERPEASDEEIRDYLAGNLCRCGSYVKILDSMRDAIARMRQ